MRISIITVCYNSAKTIADTIASVASQQYGNCEHIVIDGASSDGTTEIVKNATSIAQYISEPDQGIYDAMNKGLDRASGDLICFLNADDTYASTDVLSKVAHEMQQHDLDALIGDVAFFRRDNPTRVVRRYHSNRFRPGRLAWGWMPAHPALFLRKEVVRQVGYFKTDYRIAGDFDFIVRAFHGQPLKYRHIPEVLVRMQIGGISTGGWRSTVRLNQEVLRACRENGLNTHVLKILSKYPMKLMEFFLP